MSVVAKFYVADIETFPNSDNARISMYPVCRGVENASWASATPSGNLIMNVLNVYATAQFEKGAEYYIRFEKAVKPLPGDGHQIVPVTDKYGHQLCEVCGMQVGTRAHKDSEVATPIEGAAERHEQTYGVKVEVPD